MRSAKNKKDPEEIVKRYPGYRLVKSKLEPLDYEFAELDNIIDELKCEVYDFYYSDIESDTDVLSTKKKENKDEVFPVTFKYQEKYEVYDTLYKIRRLTNQYLSAFERYAYTFQKFTSSMLTLLRNFSIFIDKFKEGLRGIPIFKNVGSSIISIRQELAMFTLRFLMAENDYLIKRVDFYSCEWEFISGPIDRRVVKNEKDGHSKLIYELLVVLMRHAFTPTLEYKSDEFTDLYCTNQRMPFRQFNNLFTNRDSESKYVTAAYYDPMLASPFRDIENISLEKIVFQMPHTVLEEEKNRPFDVAHIAKKILYRNIDFFKAAFNLNEPELFQKWAKAHIEDIHLLSHLLREAIIEDIDAIENRAEIKKLLKKNEKSFQHPYYLRRKCIKGILSQFLFCQKKILKIVVGYAVQKNSILHALDDVLPGKTNFEGVIHMMHQSLDKAYKTQNPDHILSGFYAYGYNINKFCINRSFLENFVQAIVEHENLIDKTAKKWSESWSPQRLFKHRVIKIRIKKDDNEELSWNFDLNKKDKFKP